MKNGEIIVCINTHKGITKGKQYSFHSSFYKNNILYIFVFNDDDVLFNYPSSSFIPLKEFRLKKLNSIL